MLALRLRVGHLPSGGGFKYADADGGEGGGKEPAFRPAPACNILKAHQQIGTLIQGHCDQIVHRAVNAGCPLDLPIDALGRRLVEKPEPGAVQRIADGLQRRSVGAVRAIQSVGIVRMVDDHHPLVPHRLMEDA